MNKLLVVFLFLTTLLTYGQDREVVILDMTKYNSETNLSRYYAVQQLLDLTGVAYDSTSSLTEALTYPIIITGSRITQDAFTLSERLDLENYLSNGGVLFTSNLRDTNFRNLCGVDSIISDNEVFSITWDTLNYSSNFEMIDDSMEVTISLGRESSGTTFYSRTFTLSTGEAWGYYENGKAAFVHNEFGLGHVYTLGSDFRDVIYRTRINQDINAQRVYSNGFEPSSDVIMMLVRNIIGKHIPNQVYKYTAPGNYSSVMCLTHDIDSRTAVDTMMAFVDSEVAHGVVAQYNITVRYLSDGWMTNFYIGAHQEITYIRDQGHTLASHSVGHFPDFENESVFGFGTLGNTPANYQPAYFSGMTVGGSILGETEVSKNLLEDDFSVAIRSWRSGHLAFPDSLGLALDTLGYEFNSTYSSNDILTNFPFYAIHDGSFSGHPCGVLEIPMTISDVFSSDPISEMNYMDKVAIWSDVNERYDRNNSSTILLIHPNRGWKLEAQEAFLDSLQPDQGVIAFEDFGEFWRKRDSLRYTTDLVNNDTEMEVQILNELGDNQSFVIDTSGLLTITFKDQFGSVIPFQSEYFLGSKKLYYQNDFINVGGVETIKQFSIQLYPNPTRGMIYVAANLGAVIDEIIVYDLHGSQLTVKTDLNGDKAIIHLGNDMAQGVYLVKIESEGLVGYKKVILQRD